MTIKLERDGSNLITYVNLNEISTITEQNGVFEFKYCDSTVASFSVANTTVSYCNDGNITVLPRDTKIISNIIMQA